MNFNLCPTCLADNPEDARFCQRCGQVLADDTVPQPLAERETQFLPGGLWLDDLQAPPPPAPGRSQPLNITLRNVDARPLPPPAAPPAPPEVVWSDAPAGPGLGDLPELPELHEPAEPPAAAAAQAWPPLPQAVEAIDLPPLRQVPRLDDVLVPAGQPAGGANPAPQAQLEAKRAARRASVRRSRLRQLAQHLDPSAPREILVIDRQDIERGILCGLLQAFGFTTHSVADPAQAMPLLETTAFAAVFADMAFDGADGGASVALVRRLKSLQPKPLFVLVTPPLSPVDRVRAELTGCDDMVHKRVTRGSVARVLDVHGIPLPADARRT